MGKGVEVARNNLILPLSNFDLLDAVKKLKIKNFRGVFMRDQLPERPNNVETGIINLDKKSGPGTHWVAYAIDPRGIIYFDSYGLSPPEEFLNYVNGGKIWYSTLPTQTLTDPPICGVEVLNVLDAISKSTKPPHKVAHEYSLKSYLNKNQQI